MRVSYEDFMSQQTQQKAPTNTKPNNYVKYLSLKDDGDEAIVRFMYDSDVKQLLNDVLDVHIMNNGKWDVKYNCLRDPREPLDNCPMCKAGKATQRKFYIKLIQYFNDNGTIRAEARIWERSPSYVATLKSFMSEYSPLSDYIFKIKRVGQAGDKNTKYTIIPCNPSVYTSAVYKKDVSLFDNYDVLGTIVMDKNWDELQELVSEKTQINTSTQPQQPQQTTRQYPTNQSQENMPWGNQSTQFTPRRY